MTPSYALGLLFIFLVAVIWALASIVVQYLYKEQHFDSPFLLTYIGTSLFVLLLPSRLLWERRKRCLSSLVGHQQHVDGDDQQQGLEIIPWRQDATRSTAYQTIPASTLTTSVDTIPQADDDEQQEEAQDEVEEAETRIQNDNKTITRGFSSSSLPSAMSVRLLSHQQHFWIAFKIAPVWFFANWTYNMSLAYTSITSSTVLASTGSLFTFVFAVACRDETFTLMKLLGVVLCVTGSILTALHDFGGNDDSTNNENDDAIGNSTTTFVTAGHLGTPHHHIKPDGFDPWEGHALLGDFLGLLSAVGYGMYCVMIRVYCPRDESCFSMQLLLGYVGLVNAVALSPIALNVLFSSSSLTAEHLTWIIFGYLVVKGLLDNVLSDYLWARAVVLTSATIATVGLGLTIPLAFVSDLFLGHEGIVTIESILGALAVLAGFILVNLDGEDSEQLPAAAATEGNGLEDTLDQVVE